MDTELLVILVGGGCTIAFWLGVRLLLKVRSEQRTGTDEQRRYLDQGLRRYGLELIPGETLDQGLHRLEKARAICEQYNRVTITHNQE